MALQLTTGLAAGAASKELDIRSVGTRMVPFRLYCANNTAPLVILGSPTNAAVNYITLGTIAGGGGSLTIEEPVDYIKVQADPAEAGGPNVFIATSR